MANIFFPLDFDEVPVLTVGVPLYTIRATIHNPETNSDIQLPDHVWMLVRGSGTGARAISRSDISDANGTCFLGAAANTLTNANFSFLFAPFPKPSDPNANAIRASYKVEREAWIDLDKPTVWALPPDPKQLERRRLIRVPAWTSLRKATTGGFKVVPPKTTQFASQGFIPFSEIDVFGTKATPWDMPLDFNWARARIKFSFFDWNQNKEETLPPGLLIDVRRDPVKALGQQNTNRVGAGISASMKDGTVYTMIEGTKDVWKECHVSFRTPGACFIDLSSGSTPSPDTRLTAGAPPAVRANFNSLPPRWHSHGMRASFTTSPRANPGSATPPTPDKVWDQLHFDLAADAQGDTATINFHLDDVVLCDKNVRAIAINPTDQPPTLFDHFLTILKPSPAPKPPFQSDVKFVGRVIPAATAYGIPAPTGAGKPKVLEQATRLVHFEANFYDLRDDRIVAANIGEVGKVLCVGARAALENQHPFAAVNRPIASTNNANAGLGLQMHLIDVPGVNDPGTSTPTPLQHVLIYIPTEFEVDPAFSSTARSAQPTMEEDARKVLHTAAETWSAGHPGVPASKTKTKSYALVPQAAANRGKRITRIRFFFAESKRSPKLKIVLTENTAGSRANTAGGTIDNSFFFPKPPTPTRIVYFNTAVSSDVAGTSQAFTDSGDSATAPFTILTHELGHAMGLMDEYCEALDPKVLNPALLGLSHPFMPTFSQIDEGFSDWRPYYNDAPAMMANNALPRLRHLWHHAQNTNSQLKPLPDGPYQLTHVTFATAGGTGLNYNVPPNDNKSPWDAIFRDVQIPNGRGQAALFPLGDDEGTVESMFQSPAVARPGFAPANRMRGLLLVRSRVGFILDPAMTGPEKINVLSANFHNKIYDAKYFTKIRFFLLATVPSPFPRIAILFQPLYGVADNSAPPLRAGAHSQSELLTSADIVFDLLKTATTPRPNPFLGNIGTARGTRVNAMASDFTFELAWRLVLGVPTALPGGTAPNLGTIQSPDIVNLARLVEQQLGEPPNSRQILIFS